MFVAFQSTVTNILLSYNSIWPIEVIEELTASGSDASVKGFDISTASFPDPALLPSTVQLHVQDAFAPFELQYDSCFDLVQIRGFVSFTRSAGANKLLQNVFQILSKLQI